MHRARQLDERQRIAGRLPDDPIAHASRQAGRAREDHRSRDVVVEGPERELVDAGGLDRRQFVVASREQQDQRIRPQSTRHERERVLRRTVEPLDVIGDDEDRRIRRGIGQECQRGDGDEEWVVGGVRCESECCRKCQPLGTGQSVQAAQDRPQELVEAGKRKVRLRPHPNGAQDSDPARSRRLDRPSEQGRLADPGIAADQERPTTLARPPDEVVDRLQLAVAAEDPDLDLHRRILAGRTADVIIRPPIQLDGSARKNRPTGGCRMHNT